MNQDPETTLATSPNCPGFGVHLSFASRLVMDGVPLYTVSKLLNHKDPTVIKRYAHLSPAHRKEVAEKAASLATGWLSRLDSQTK